MASRSLITLSENTRKHAELWLAECERQGLDILVVCTYRSPDEQNALYAQGRTTKGHIVTNARGGESQHNFRRAIDFCIMRNGKCQWNDKLSFTKAGLIAESFGFEWAGHWSGSLKEVGHIQLKKGL